MYVDGLGPNYCASHVSQIALGKALAAAKRKLVYGGGLKGIMGIVSAAALDAGGDVVGVVPYPLLPTVGEGERVAGDVSTPLFIKSREDGGERVGVVRFRDPSSY
jgi:hypothetical protein